MDSLNPKNKHSKGLSGPQHISPGAWRSSHEHRRLWLGVSLSMVVVLLIWLVSLKTSIEKNTRVRPESNDITFSDIRQKLASTLSGIGQELSQLKLSVSQISQARLNEEEINELAEKLQEKSNKLQTATSTDEKTDEGIDTSDWQTYINEEFGFSFEYPPKSTIEQRMEQQHTYVRLQNYIDKTDANLYDLKPGEYFLEISLSDISSKQVISQPCESFFDDANLIISGNRNIYRGVGKPGGDAGGKRFSLCSEDPVKQIYIQVTENHIAGPITKAILDTFKFIKE